MRDLIPAGEASFRGKKKKMTFSQTMLGLGMKGVLRKEATISLSTEAESQQKLSNLLFRDYP